MQYRDEWKALSDRIRGLSEALHLHAAILRVNSNDSFSVASRLIEHYWKTCRALRNFRDTFRDILPHEALEALGELLNRSSELRSGMLVSETPDIRSERLYSAVVMLSAFEAEMTFALSDVQQAVRARSERAFNHLQRSIIVDPKASADWKKAFEKNEVACEKLGAIHLLLHGIYAFKAHADGGRTDLVFQEPMQHFERELPYADGLVLTEWKKVTQGDVNKKCEQARSQAANYAHGVLGGTELTNYRYVVAVSRDYVPLPENMQQGEIIYLHKNIAISPKVPSRRRPPVAGAFQGSQTS